MPPREPGPTFPLLALTRTALRDTIATTEPAACGCTTPAALPNLADWPNPTALGCVLHEPPCPAAGSADALWVVVGLGHTTPDSAMDSGHWPDPPTLTGDPPAPSRPW